MRGNSRYSFIPLAYYCIQFNAKIAIVHLTPHVLGKIVGTVQHFRNEKSSRNAITPEGLLAGLKTVLRTGRTWHCIRVRGIML